MVPTIGSCVELVSIGSLTENVEDFQEFERQENSSEMFFLLVLIRIIFYLYKKKKKKPFLKNN